MEERPFTHAIHSTKLTNLGAASTMGSESVDEMRGVPGAANFKRKRRERENVCVCV